MYVNYADAFYTCIRVWVYACVHMVTRIVKCAHTYTYMRIYADTCVSDVSLLFRTKTFLCFIVVKEKEAKKATSRQRKINILHKGNGDHVTNTHVASLHVFIK